MGQAEVNGRLTNVETIEGGMFRLEIIEGDSSKFVYSKTVTMRPFMQRFMYRRYIANKNPKPNEPKGSFHRTIMADSLNIDLKDNTAGSTVVSRLGTLKTSRHCRLICRT